MKQKKYLHEIIQAAKAGKTFKAWHPFTNTQYSHETIKPNKISWHTEEICTLWDYEEIKEPEVLEFILNCKTLKPDAALDSDIHGPSNLQYELKKGKKWKCVLTEIVGDE